MNEAIGMYIIGVVVGAAIPIAIGQYRNNRRSELTESLLTETIGQHAYLRATKETVDDKTDEQIKNRGEEILEEYDLELVDPTEVQDVQ